jgi:hypothetical protein
MDEYSYALVQAVDAKISGLLILIEQQRIHIDQLHPARLGPWRL